MQGPTNRNLQHCREVIRACLNIVEERGDTYVAIHRDADIECVIIVSMIRKQDFVRHCGGQNPVCGWKRAGYVPHSQ